MNELNLNSLRTRKARLSAHIGKIGFEVMTGLIWIFGAASVFFFLQDGKVSHQGFLFCGLTLLVFIVAIWDKWDLNKILTHKPAKSLDDVLEPHLLAKFNKMNTSSPRLVWHVAELEWQGRFLLNHLLLDPNMLAQTLSNETSDMPAVWQKAQDLMDQSHATEINGATLVASLLTNSQATKDFLSKLSLREEDVTEVYMWFERLNKFIKQPNPYFGGIGRDWAAGFTPTLDRFGVNISREVESGHVHFHTLAHSDILEPIIHNLNGGSVGLVGEVGSGKTSLVYALAERLLQGRDKELQYFQVFSLDASTIMSEAKDSLENIFLALLNEAVHARNAIIFLDDAKLFFGTGTGAFDISQVLLPVIKSRQVKIIGAFTPDEFQQLKAINPELTSHMPEVVVKEPDTETIIDILEDTALGMEQRENILISYQTIQEAYRLSGQFMQELAYPGRAINLLEQSMSYVQDKLMTPESIQQAIERTKGVKVSKASAPEADTLLHLEDKIHSRMVNQERAVRVVSAALRRGRAGVTDPNRPIGSFLFLGPTGVGKTELARSLAATYFGNERQMIRLDMSEYQQPDDVARLLEAGSGNTKSLILKIREQPFSVILLDEVEKAHPNILNLLLQLLDEGQLTDEKGHVTSFKNAIIIATSNAGSAEITHRVGTGESLESFERPLLEKLIAGGQFKPELINRFDEVVLFRPLNKSELAQVASLMLGEINKTLKDKNITLKLTEAALNKVIEAGYDPEFGARPMRRALQRMVEDAVAKKMLSNEAQVGSTITLDVQDLSD